MQYTWQLALVLVPVYCTVSCYIYYMQRLILYLQIAEVDYPRIHDDSYSPLVSEVIQCCLTSDPKARADSVQVRSCDTS